MTYLLICLAVLSSAIAVPLSETPVRATNPDDYLLPLHTYPTFYDVQLYLDPDNESTFNGSISIRVLFNSETNVIVLHAMEVDLHSVVVRADASETNILSSYTLATDDTHLLTLQLNETLNAFSRTHIIEIDYTARFAENMFGVYRSTYATETGTQSLITSQLQPTFSRRAFPCFDEPHFKAIFRTTIYAPAAYPVVRSNMPLREDPLKPDVPGYVKHEFQDTLTMSSYLLAYLVSDFANISNEENPIYDVPFKVFSRPGTEMFAEYALDFGQRNMIALENYTEFPYAFPKVDKAAVPDFAAGAMENWGLVIYREVALLVREGVTTSNIRQNIARIICHENTHMWFGNEVSPVYWTYTWLNEGFANFFENYGTDLVLPGYRMMDQFVLQTQNVMQSDAVLGVNPMTHPVYTPSEIISTFNAVAYQKSGAVIRMMQHALTPEIYQRGLIIYLRQMSRQAATPPNLYAGFQAALDASNHSIPWSVATVMDRWATQGGFPVLSVSRTAASAESFYVSQERFLTDPTLSASERWHVPINWVLSTNIDFSDTAPQAWVPTTFPAVSIDIPGLSQAEWFIVNKQQTGYYRVNYDPENWEAIAQVLQTSHETIHVLNRAQIVDDSFNLARNGRLNYKHPFEISKYLVEEKDYIPWGSANNAYSYIDIVLSGSEVYDLFQQYLLNLTAPLFEELGFEAQTGEEHVTAFHRNIILDINCRYGNEICINEAESLLQSFRDNTDVALNPDIQTTVFCSGLRRGDVDSFNFLWERYQASTDSSEQSILLNSLGCTPDEELLDFFLGQVIDDSSPVREQDKHSVVVSVINASPQNMEKALDFVVEHFHEIQPRVQGLTGTTNILNTFARRLNSAEHSAKMDDFMTRHASILTAGEAASVGAIRENIDASITWTNENLETVSAWLQENFSEDDGNSATSVTSSIVLLTSVIIAFFNR